MQFDSHGQGAQALACLQRKAMNPRLCATRTQASGVTVLVALGADTAKEAGRMRAPWPRPCLIVSRPQSLWKANNAAGIVLPKRRYHLLRAPRVLFAQAAIVVHMYICMMAKVPAVTCDWTMSPRHVGPVHPRQQEAILSMLRLPRNCFASKPRLEFAVTPGTPILSAHRIDTTIKQCIESHRQLQIFGRVDHIESLFLSNR